MAEIDRFEIRREIGRAARAIEDARVAAMEMNDGESKRLLGLLRAAQAEVASCNAAYDAHRKKTVDGSAPADALSILSTAKMEYKDLAFYDGSTREPVLCAASGLAIFVGDELYGEFEYGLVILKAAVDLKVSIDL